MEHLLTVGEFLTRYKVSRSNFYREVQAGRILLRKMGTASRISREDAEAWANALPVGKGAGA